jgi:catechol 2,3-dioxygenase
MSAFKLPDETRVSRVHLRTQNLAPALEFYQRIIRLRVSDQTKSEGSLSASESGPPFLFFSEDRNAVPRSRPSTGLNHFAIRFPTRLDLAQALLRIVAADYPINGGTDFGVAESIYLTDADGNNVELYYDRPRSEWPMENGRLRHFSERLDFAGLVAAADDESLPEHAPAQADVGHINLHVADLEEAEKFFHEFLGFDVTARIPGEASFLGTGGYHHYVAVNTWAGKLPPPENSVGLISYRLAVQGAQVPDILKERARSFGYESKITDDVLQIRDPNGHWLQLEAAFPLI